MARDILGPCLSAVGYLHQKVSRAAVPPNCSPNPMLSDIQPVMQAVSEVLSSGCLSTDICSLPRIRDDRWVSMSLQRSASSQAPEATLA